MSQKETCIKYIKSKKHIKIREVSKPFSTKMNYYIFQNMSKDPYELLLKRISIQIKKARLNKGLTQEQMRDYGFNYRYYQKLESGKCSVNIYTLYRLSFVFDVKITYFFKE